MHHQELQDPSGCLSIPFLKIYQKPEVALGYSAFQAAAHDRDSILLFLDRFEIELNL